MNSEKAIESKEQLVEWFKLGNKNKKDWKVGTEHEKFAYNFSEKKSIFTPADYESLNGIKSFLFKQGNSFDDFMEFVNDVYVALENTSLSNQLFNFQKDNFSFLSKSNAIMEVIIFVIDAG